MQYVYQEPTEYGFVNQDGHDGKFFETNSDHSSHIIVECKDKLTVNLTQKECEFNYYIVDGEGYFIINGDNQLVSKGDLVVIPPNTKYTFGGRLKMLVISTPNWTAEQQILEPRDD